ncbi:unnamed protein product [Psylliodes chrysocephalus]|uniref:Uncharacterized protein n=1 Tax=Psylliodes chrysocephalus TaxID=3402493 RepID=A0A9P0GD68_9CUCU|nr:unnamed protein product [Psylliodes chrysocephala]
MTKLYFAHLKKGDSSSGADDHVYDDGEDNSIEETTNRSLNEVSTSQSEESHPITKNSSQSVPLPTNTKSSGTQVKRPCSSFTNVTNKKVLQLVADPLTKNDNTKDDMCTAFGNHIAAELSNMAPEMLPYVKKIIKDAIFEGQMRSLNKTAIITQPLS